MLVFAGVNTDDSNLRASIDRPSQRKIVKRPSRGSAKAANALNGSQTPTNASTQRPSALELLSRSAPVAPSKLYQRQDSDMDGVPPSTPTKRPSTYMEHFHTAGGAVVTPTFAKRKYTKRSANKLPFMDRIEEAAAPVAELPNVEDTVINAYDARNTGGVGDPELTILSRSLLHTAMAVKFAEEEKESEVTTSVQAPLEHQAGGIKIDPLHGGEPSDGREALSPTAAGLFCEEDYSEAAGDDETHQDFAEPNGNGGHSDTKPTYDGSNGTKRQEQRPPMNLSVMQERAVLQEFSVWLRNLAAGVTSM
ncbi:unnamed protein product [Phytophthora lilii]|uniref:Unnamed protein product n=1 Tax=Phytophthora lilii TaxID=2077276 RepID=A0A9W6WPH3_9STRA|nr:unnamed protein product [Phytophthora lilii]